jgi:hypothetical protein
MIQGRAAGRNSQACRYGRNWLRQLLAVHPDHLKRLLLAACALCSCDSGHQHACLHKHQRQSSSNDIYSSRTDDTPQHTQPPCMLCHRLQRALCVPQHARSSCSVACVGGRLYVMGGSTGHEALHGGEPCTVVEVYDPLTGSWANRAPLSCGRSGLAAVAV